MGCWRGLPLAYSDLDSPITYPSLSQISAYEMRTPGRSLNPSSAYSPQHDTRYLRSAARMEPTASVLQRSGSQTLLYQNVAAQHNPAICLNPQGVKDDSNKRNRPSGFSAIPHGLEAQ
jgi:hypothetical protein